jgi:hypothetical protein
MKKFAIEFKWAIIFTICSLAWTVMEKQLGWHDEKIEMQQIYTMSFGIVAIVLYVLALLDKKKDFFNGTMDWKQGFLSGSILALFIALMTPLTQYISFTAISPTYFDKLIDLAVKNNKMTLEAAQNYFNINNYVYSSTFSNLSYGIVIAAIVALFVKSKKV